MPHKPYVLLFLMLAALPSIAIRAQGTLCEQFDFYWQQLSVDCKAIAGPIISTVKEHHTKRILPGMAKGQCSGSQPYTNDFVKFYTQLLTPAAADSAWKYWREELLICLKPPDWKLIADAELDKTLRQMRWQKRLGGHTEVVILEETPDPDADGFLTIIKTQKPNRHKN